MACPVGTLLSHWVDRMIKILFFLFFLHREQTSIFSKVFRFVQSFFHWLIHFASYQFMHSLIYSFIYSFNHLFIQPFIHSVIFKWCFITENVYKRETLSIPVFFHLTICSFICVVILSSRVIFWSNIMGFLYFVWYCNKNNNDIKSMGPKCWPLSLSKVTIQKSRPPPLCWNQQCESFSYLVI